MAGVLHVRQLVLATIGLSIIACCTLIALVGDGAVASAALTGLLMGLLPVVRRVGDFNDDGHTTEDAEEAPKATRVEDGPPPPM